MARAITFKDKTPVTPEKFDPDKRIEVRENTITVFVDKIVSIMDTEREVVILTVNGEHNIECENPSELADKITKFCTGVSFIDTDHRDLYEINN